MCCIVYNLTPRLADLSGVLQTLHILCKVSCTSKSNRALKLTALGGADRDLGEWTAGRAKFSGEDPAGAHSQELLSLKVLMKFDCI